MDFTIIGYEYGTNTKQTIWEVPSSDMTGCSRELLIMVRDAQPTDKPLLRWYRFLMIQFQSRATALRLVVLIAFSLSGPSMALAQDRAAVSRSDLLIRDPFIVPDIDTQTYYLYKSAEVTLGNGEKRPGVVAFTSKDLETWHGPKPVFHYPDDCWAGGNIWAPEVGLSGRKMKTSTLVFERMCEGAS